MCPLVYVPGWTVPPGAAAEGKDGWDQGTTGTDRYIGSFGGPQPAVSGAEMDSVLSKVHKCVLYIHVCVCVCVCVFVCVCCVCGGGGCGVSVCVCVYVWV